MNANCGWGSFTSPMPPRLLNVEYGYRDGRWQVITCKTLNCESNKGGVSIGATRQELKRFTTSHSPSHFPSVIIQLSQPPPPHLFNPNLWHLHTSRSSTHILPYSLLSFESGTCSRRGVKAEDPNAHSDMRYFDDGDLTDGLVCFSHSHNESTSADRLCDA